MYGVGWISYISMCFVKKILLCYIFKYCFLCFGLFLRSILYLCIVCHMFGYRFPFFFLLMIFLRSNFLYVMLHIRYCFLCFCYRSPRFVIDLYFTSCVLFIFSVYCVVFSGIVSFVFSIHFPNLVLCIWVLLLVLRIDKNDPVSCVICSVTVSFASSLSP